MDDAQALRMSSVAPRRDNDMRPIVRFVRVAREDVAASREAGFKVFRDVDMVKVTPVGGKDVFDQDTIDWLRYRDDDARNERVPLSWVQRWKEEYAAWKDGQELPVEGTPIRGWGMITPAEQETLIAIGVRTVEVLAQMNDEAVRRCGPLGAGLKMKQTAQAWLAQLTDMGGLAAEMANLKQENALLKGNCDGLQKTVSDMQAQLERLSHPTVVVEAPRQEVSASDLIDEPVRPRRAAK
jgi:hypothetical protein